jgi:hypothetical protein
MRVSRRMFLGAVGAVPALARGGVTLPRCVVVDLGCVLRESLAGFRGQVGDLRYGDGDTEILIAPGVNSLDGDAREFIRRRLRRGATVVLEYAGGARISTGAYFPYVEYFWPVRVKIREFAPVLLQPAPGDEIVATFQGQPAGLRRGVWDGTLVTLGSPLGPVFLTGDPDARRWLDALVQLHIER